MYGCQSPWIPVEQIQDWDMPNQPTPCTHPQTGEPVPCVNQCIKGFDGPPLAFQDAINNGTDMNNVARFLAADSVTPYPYPHVPNGNDDSADLMWDLDVEMSGPSAESFTVKIYDPFDK